MTNSQALPDIKSLDRTGLAELADELGEAPFRAKQMEKWLYGRAVKSFDEMTDMPKGMRAYLAERWAISSPTIRKRQQSKDGTRKYLVRLGDGATIESVGMPSGDDRLTVCFSTQAGCAMGCAFCATGRGGLVRDLTAGEMVDQVISVGADMGKRVSNAVAMGQGEPFANYDATLGALRFLNAPDGPGIGARHITVSTCGLIPGIRRFTREPEQFTLAISLHSAVQATRNRLMPGVKAYPLRALREAIADYVDVTDRRPTFEYALINGVNDTTTEIDALVRFCEGLLCHVNLIPVNVVEGSDLERTGDLRVRETRIRLMRAGIETSIRVERGSDIDAACGQLRQRHEKGSA